jgi:anti-sigma factor RsiW
MTRCDKFADRLSILALGDLSPSETQELQEHMVNCASCLTEFQGLRDLLGELKTLPLAQSRAPAFQEQGEAIL